MANEKGKSMQEGGRPQNFDEKLFFSLGIFL